MKRRKINLGNETEAQNYELSLEVLSLMRRKHLSFDAACNAVGIDRKTALRFIGSELRQEESGGRYVVTPHDFLPRTVHFITTAGTVPVTVMDSRTASRIAEHMNAVRAFTHRGDPSALGGFHGETFEAGGVTYEFVTDLTILTRLADADELGFDGLYRAVQG